MSNKPVVEVTRSPNGTTEDKSYRIKYSENGKIQREDWWVDGKRTQIDAPVFTEYDEDGNVLLELCLMCSKPHQPSETPA